jgi:uncharacterized membrane protein
VKTVNKKVLGIAVVLMAVAMLALPVSIVSAAKPEQISGGWMVTDFSPIPPTKNAGANRFTLADVEGVYTSGPIVGTFEHELVTILHFGNPEQTLPSKFFNWKMVRTFEGTVNGKAGTLIIHLTATGVMGAPAGTLKGKWVIISGTGELANLQGQGTFTNVGGGSGAFAYEGQIHFNP